MIAKRQWSVRLQRRIISSCCVFVCALPASYALAQPAEEAAFAAVREAFTKGERVRLTRAVATLGTTHPLTAWGEYFVLLQRLADGSDDGMEAFLTRQDGTYLAEKARGDWIRWLMKREDWSAARIQFAALERPDAEMQCRGADLRLRLGEPEARDAALAQLAADAPLADACRPPLGRLADAQALPEELLWQRLQRQLALGKMKEARLLVDWLPAAHAPSWRTLDAIDDHPARHLAKLPERFAASRAGRLQALFAVTRMARTDARIAAARWNEIAAQFPAVEQGTGWGWIAYRAALGHLTEAGDWYEQAVAPGAPLDDEQHAWRVRAALRAENWPQVARAIAALPPALASQPEWIYWQARAEAALGHREAADTLLRRIAGQPHFYGTLAAESLGQPLTLSPRAVPPTTDELATVAARPGLLRGLALIQQGMRLDGLREWNWPLVGMSDRELLAAAELARRQNVIDRAINTADRTRAEHDFSQRYPTPFFDQVEPRVRSVGLDPAWVYGLMRQESRFIMDAKSGAGAKGLMQLMPATAKWVAKKIGMTHYHPGKVTEMGINVTLGTHYMKMVMDSLDHHPALASAAYNAGPGRARKWRAERPIEGAIYAETIPFNETRDYVKKVLANAVHYAAVMGIPGPTLTERLGTVRPRGFGDTTAEDLP